MRPNDRPSTHEPQPVRALILSGGGARGAYEAGVAAALAERMHFDIVCGTSIGAVNGFAVAQGMAGQLEAIWREASDLNVAPYRPDVGALLQLWNEFHSVLQHGSVPAHLRDVVRLCQGLPGLRNLPRLENLLGVLDNANMRQVVTAHARRAELQSALLLAATNLTNACGTVFAFFPSDYADTHGAADVMARKNFEPITEENYIDAICASAALPGAFEPVTVLCEDGRRRTFVDGAFTNNMPLRPAIDAGATEIIAISVDPLVSTDVENEVRHLRDVVTLALEAATSQMLQVDLELLQLRNDAMDKGEQPGKRHITLREVCPEAALPIDPLDFGEPGVIAELVSQGRRDAERTFDAVPTP
ncbi:MAG TPA: patatin-like phospholipase family protein [Candidatus Elarobacter sp.]|jgi:NTE family protein|nr:patatin-like phospholipase family protein [Candidatus Elarobacter sp.]